MEKTLEQRLAELAGRRLAIVCVGNPLRGDDGFGPAVAARVEGDAVFDAGSVPENVLPKVAGRRPEVVLFVDAGRFGAEPGALRLVLPEELAQTDFSTHSAPLDVSAEYLRNACGAKSMLLVAQPRKTDLGSVMSVEMVRAAERAAALLRGML